MTMKMLRKIWYIPVLMMMGGTLLFLYVSQPAFRMTMDVNPSVEVVTNRLERVIEVNAKNEDAAQLLEGYEIKNPSIEATIEDLVDRMIFKGFLHGGEDQLVMISVKDPEADTKVVDKINATIRTYLENRKIEATILSSSFEEFDQELTGKERTAKKLSSLGVSLSEEILLQMTLQELFDYSRAQNISSEALFHVVHGRNQEVPSSDDKRLSLEEIREIALNEVPGEILKLEREDDHYEVKIYQDGKKYELEIHGYTGAIKEFEVDDDEDDKGQAPTRTRLTMAEARAIALAKVSGTILKEESDDDSYDFDIRKDGKTYELEIHGYTGAVKEFEVDDDDDEDDKVQAPTRTRLTMAEARAIALARVSGTILKEESDDDSYDFDIRKEGKTYELEIHAYTGAVKEFEVDDDDDEDDKVQAPTRTRLTMAEARAIALAKVPGTIVDEEEDDDSFDFEIKLHGKEYELEINAYTGVIEEFEVEDDD